MKKTGDLPQMLRFLWRISLSLFVILMIAPGGNAASVAVLQEFTNARLIADSSNDGDSFLVDAGGKRLHIRLYFVDCPETSAGSKNDADRVRAQTRYFGLSGVDITVHYGNEAKKFTEQVLSRPFTLHTAFASALGRSSGGRVYGFITTFEGEDLASLLVKNGLARAEGKGRKTPAGTPRSEMIDALRDLEASAMLKRTGIWAKSNAEKMLDQRSEQRSEDNELKEIQSQVEDSKAPHTLLDPNKASKDELLSVNGIGPILAERIIAGRPYKSIDDLLRVKGIGKSKLEKIRSYFKSGGR